MNMQAQRENSKKVNKLNAEFFAELNNVNGFKFELKESKGFRGMRNYSATITMNSLAVDMHLTTAGKDAVEIKEWFLERLASGAKDDTNKLKHAVLNKALEAVNKYKEIKEMAAKLESELKINEAPKTKKLKI